MAFDEEINGNNKNRLFLPLHAPILTVTRIDVGGIELDVGFWTYDVNSVFLDESTSGSTVGDPELIYRFLRTGFPGLFPHGHNNIRIRGTFGDAVVPANITELAKIMVEYENDDTLYTASTMESEKIGDYSYKIGTATYETIPVVTGILEADKIFAIYAKQKKAVLMTP